MATFLSQIAKITDHLYLSSFVGATELNVTKFGITCVITVCKEVPKLDLKNVESVKLEVVDRPTESLIKYFDFVTDKIKEVADKNGACLVHCVAGVSRSATMVLAYLMKHCKLTLRDAHSLVKSKRPFVSILFVVRISSFREY
jgi:atypical dual specificity phosphatase